MTEKKIHLSADTISQRVTELAVTEEPIHIMDGLLINVANIANVMDSDDQDKLLRYISTGAFYRHIKKAMFK